MYFAVNGKKVFATTGGKAFDHEKPVVIFLHGSGLDHTFWGLHSRFFAFRKYAVLVPDLPGHSHSEGAALTSIESMADWLNDVVTTLDIDNISLVAHSQGCLTALEFAARYPQKLSSVSLIASGLATPVNPALIDNAQNNPEAAIAMMTSWGFGSAGHMHQGPIPGNSMLGSGQKVMWRNVPDELATDLKACDAYQNGKAAAAKISVPIQVILGEQDRMAPRKATQELVDNLPDPEVHVIAESGHMVPLEAPDICRDLLKIFIFTNNPTP
jgi:pimeloyl-ACP methyl ester carboxylesterase